MALGSCDATFEDVTREERLYELHHALPLDAVLLSQRHGLRNDLDYAAPHTHADFGALQLMCTQTV